MRLWMIAAVLALAPVSPVLADNPALPSFKPGLWSGTVTEQMNTPGQPQVAPDTRAEAVCTGDTSIANDLVSEMKTTPDSPMDIKQAGNVWNFTTSGPDPNGGTMQSKAVMTRLSATAFTMDGTMESPHTDGHLHAAYRWIGPCPAGVTPGTDGQMVNGKFVPGP
jgi:hypothetical protein